MKKIKNPPSRIPLIQNHSHEILAQKSILDFLDGPVVKNPPAKASDMSLIPSPGRSHMPWDNHACVP